MHSLKLIWPTRSRTGSQFVVQLTTAFAGDSMISPQARVDGSRRDTFKAESKIGNFREMFNAGSGMEYLSQNGIKSLKYEDPGKDDFVLDLLEHAPNALFIASHRRIESVIESHANIESWGHSEADVLYQFSASLYIYREIASKGRLFLIDLDNRELFSAEAFASFLGIASINSKAQKLVDDWRPINDLKYQIEKSGRNFQGRKKSSRIERLREIHPWIDDLGNQYHELCVSSSSPDRRIPSRDD